MGGASSKSSKKRTKFHPYHVMSEEELLQTFDNLSRSSIPKIKKIFDELRGDKPYLTREEFIKFHLEEEGAEPTDADCREFALRIWNAFDVDGNNKMDVCFYVE